MTDGSPAPQTDEHGPAGAARARRSLRSGLVRAGIILSAAFLISRGLGYVRTVVLGATFGTGPELDAFFAAFRVPDLIFQVVAAGAMGSALIPVVAGLMAGGERAHAWRVVGTLANLLLVALTVLAAAAFVGAPLLVRALAPGFDDEAVARTTDLTRIMLAAPVLLALGAVATSALNAEGRFGAAAVAPIVYNLGIIGGALFLAPSLGVAGLAWGVVAGALGHVLVQLPALFGLGFRPARGIDLADTAARKVLGLLAPRALGLGASQLTFIVMTALASSLGEGAISSYTIAFALLQIPVGILGVPLGVVLFPSMSRDHALGEIATFVSMVTRAVRLLVFAMVPIAAIGIALRAPVVELLFGYGRFDTAAVESTAATLALFLLGLPAHASIAVLARSFYAQQDTRTPVAAAILAVVVNTLLGIMLVEPLGLRGLALAIAVAAWLEAAVLLVALGRRVPSFDRGGIVRVLAESAAGGLAAWLATSAAAGVLTGLLEPGAPKLELLAGSTLATIAGGGAYLVVALALRIPELPSIVGLVTDQIRRRRSA
ncbi:MAG TPA: murein biosynthesis integral membrane protein MurJ [Candidatus Limnocylindrales bacterium]|nr:murein biosynthesis integral membrane protein MurJ [Candidatus Limnocylindrales bacterium]